MVNSRIIIKGTYDKEPRLNEDGSAELLLSNAYEKNANKDIRDKGKSVFLVRFSKQMYKRHKKQFSKDNKEIYVMGYVKSVVSKKGTPFIYVSPISIKFEKIEKFETKINKVMKIKNKSIPWWNLLDKDEFVEINPNKINVIEDKHLNGHVSNIDLKHIKNKGLYVTVKKNKDQYDLTLGLKALMVAKLLNINVLAYVIDMTHNELVEEFEIDEPIKSN